MVPRTPQLLAFVVCIFSFALPHPGQCAEREAKLLEKENIVETAKPRTKWIPAVVGMDLFNRDRVRTGELSRAAVQLTDFSVLRMDELTTLEVQPPQTGNKEATLDLKSGAIYFFSREKEAAVQIKTPAATGALRGTQLIVRVTPVGKTILSLLEGEVELSNPLGSILLRSGEQGEAEIGKPPRKTAMIEAVNILQWALYYPGVLDPAELGLSPADRRAVANSLAAYQEGDLLGALEKYPARYAPSSVAGKLYRAAVVLAVGQVDEAAKALQGVPASAPGRVALDRMIAAVKFQEHQRVAEPSTAGEWMAESYYQQSRSNLEGALAAARRASEVSPEFGYAAVRVAELQFSFGRTPRALEALSRGLELTPKNAQGHSLRGFLLSAQNRIDAARDSFNHAIALDGALANAWLGRGLTYIRQGKDELGRQDLQTAATLEPNRSVLHSYLGKAFSQVGDNKSARKDLKRAVELDPNDPTPWLYSALQSKQENRYNEAVRDLEKSLELNENRRVYRSRFLLDQDRSVRSSNLASIYQNTGMDEVAVREATRAVNADYGSAGAHLFLANAFNALRDPTRILLRYETQWFNELLLANLLSPVGGGPLSQFVSEQEYSKLFEADRLGISSVTEYFSYGELRETASQYGIYRNFSYALDAEYQYFDGLRPNSRLSRFEGYAQFKFQLGPQDTLFVQTKYQDLENGDIFQRFDQKEVDRSISARTFDFSEKQEPGLLLLGWHREWEPGNHTIFLAGRLANEQLLTGDDTNQLIFGRDITGRFPNGVQSSNTNGTNLSLNENLAQALREFRGAGRVSAVDEIALDSIYRASFEIYSAELNHIATLGPKTIVLGGRFQSGEFETQHAFSGVDNPFIRPLFTDPPSKQDFSVDFERFSAYLYDFWRVTPWLHLTAGVTYDRLSYPENHRVPPISDEDKSVDQVSPKAGLTLQLPGNVVLRGAYTKAISGVSFDESIRLEPTQIAGFSQVSRTYISENVVGSVAGASYQTYGVSLEQKLPTGTYWGIDYSVITQDLDRTVGVFDFFQDSSNRSNTGIIASSTEEKLVYREDVLTATVNQLIGDHWSLGARYRYSKAHLRQKYTDVQPELLLDADRNRSSGLHEVDLFSVYNHPSGFFARGEALWFNQNSDGFKGVSATGKSVDLRAGDDFWMFNFYAGYRFFRNQCEVALGVFNIGDSDYQLEPLNYYAELPRERTFFARVKISF